MTRRLVPLAVGLALVWPGALSGPGSSAAASPSSRNPAWAAASPTGGVLLPDTGALFGVHLKLDQHNGFDRRQAMLDYETLVGRPMAVDREFYVWNDDWPNADDEWSRDQGRIIYFSWDAIYSTGVCAGWANIINGDYDALIDAQAQKLIAFGAPMFFSFHHEPTTAPPGGGSCGTSPEFIGAYQHVHDRFVADGVTNVTYALTLTAQTYERGRGDEFYPGDAYVDVLAADGYNWYHCPFHPGPWRWFDTIFTPFHDFGALKGKPMVIAEYGTGEHVTDTNRKAEWFTNAADNLKKWPDIKGVSYFNVGGLDCARYVDTSPQSLDAFSTNGADPYFNPPVANGAVSVADYSFTPQTVSVAQGTGIKWTFNGPSNHTATEDTGMKLFDSGSLGPGSVYSFYFIAAGKYTYRCMIHPTLMKGRISVPTLASPLSGGEDTTFTITWAANHSPFNYLFDVQIRRPGSTWSDWLTDQTAISATFVPDGGTGTYSFRARYQNTAVGKSSKFSDPVSIIVS